MIDLLFGPARKAMLIWLLVLIVTTIYAQVKVEVFTTIDGKRFTRHQRDSIENLGNFIGVKEKHLRGDTLVYSIYYYDKSLLLHLFRNSM